MKIKSVNDAFANHYGKMKEEVIGRSFSDIFGFKEYSSEDLLPIEQEVLKTGISVVDRKIVIPGSGGRKTGLVSVTPITNDEGKVIELICSIKDITIETNLQQRREQLEDTINKSEDAVFIISLSPVPQYVFWGEGGEKVYGRPSSEFYANKNLWQEVIFPEDRKRVVIEQEYANKHNTYPLKQEYRIIHKDGNIRYVESRLFKDCKKTYSSVEDRI